MNKLGETCIDTETGEILYKSPYNAETGEYEGIPIFPQRIKFRVPPTEKQGFIKKNRNCMKLNKREVEIITAVIFLLPTMILFYPLLGIITLLFEIILHNWAHKKNRALTDTKFYYKSPLHSIVKEFCGRCKEENTTNKISKIQDMRNDKLTRYSLESIRRAVT